MAKYRWRTRLRTAMPFALIGLVQKGHHDCGAHEWYRSSGDTYLCYHCTVGIREGRPPEFDN